ncbi:MAG TPA: Ig-like domain-containing protein [candidate division Zixibacteria bacterium]|nr:Ig-like domain-containing protein [candidate division Zixibacteria bacterium]
MGLSVSIASAIVLVGWIAFIGAISTALLTTMNNVGTLANSTSSADVKLGVQLGLAIASVESRSLNFTVQNTGSLDIFLRNGTFAWNSVIVTYNNTDWQTYLIDNYTVLAINAIGTNQSFDVTSHQSIKPGEQALIQVYLPSSAPDIQVGSVVDVVFASHYGVTARQEILVLAYGEQIQTSAGGQTVPVAAAPTTLTIAVSPLSGPPGLNVTISGQLTSGSTALADETIYVYVNGTKVATSATTTSNGDYSFSYTNLTAGTYAIQTQFQGDANYAASSSATDTVTVA